MKMDPELKDLFDAYPGRLSLDNRAKHVHFLVDGQVTAALHLGGRMSGNPRTKKNTLARIKRALKEKLK
jgi:hypothetical protein